jgi:hypothetical protein
VFVQELIEHSGDGLLCVDDRCEVERDSDVDVSRCSCIFLLNNNFGLTKLKFCALTSSGSGSGTVEPELILRRP